MAGESNSSRDASKNGWKREITPETTDISGHHGYATVIGALATVGILTSRRDIRITRHARNIPDM